MTTSRKLALVNSTFLTGVLVLGALALWMHSSQKRLTEANERRVRSLQLAVVLKELVKELVGLVGGAESQPEASRAARSQPLPPRRSPGPTQVVTAKARAFAELSHSN